MAQFSIEIADTDVLRVMNAIAANYKRPEEVPNPNFDENLEIDPVTNPEMIANPEDIYQFANKIVRQFLSDNVRAYEIKQAKAQAAAGVNVNLDISDPQLP